MGKYWSEACNHPQSPAVICITEWNRCITALNPSHGLMAPWLTGSPPSPWDWTQNFSNLNVHTNQVIMPSDEHRTIVITWELDGNVQPEWFCPRWHVPTFKAEKHWLRGFNCIVWTSLVLNYSLAIPCLALRFPIWSLVFLFSIRTSYFLSLLGVACTYPCGHTMK